MTYLEIGCGPAYEDCALVHSPYYQEQMQRETREFMRMIRETVGPEPVGARLAVKAFSHEFGTYHEVVCYFDELKPTSVEYAYRCEAEAPTEWDARARSALGLVS